MAFFTPEELEELRKADADLDDTYRLTSEDIAFSRQLDREAKLAKKDNRGKKAAARSAAYYEANKEKHNAYMREYMRKRRAKKKNAASDGANIESGKPIYDTVIIP